jgi:hypothetical protein
VEGGGRNGQRRGYFDHVSIYLSIDLSIYLKKTKTLVELAGGSAFQAPRERLHLNILQRLACHQIATFCIKGMSAAALRGLDDGMRNALLVFMTPEELRRGSGRRR